MLEKLFGGRPETGSRPDIPEATTKFAEVLHQNWSIQGSTKRTADKRDRGLWGHIDGLIHRCDFCDRDTPVNCI